MEPSASGENPNESKNHSARESEPLVIFTWKLSDEEVVLTIEDSGLGLMNPGNVFVPFYTTKPGGSGIGLLLSRQISEAHGGSIELANRLVHRGCVVLVTLPCAISQQEKGSHANKSA